MAPACRSHRWEALATIPSGGPSAGKVNNHGFWRLMACCAVSPSQKFSSIEGRGGSPGATDTRPVTARPPPSAQKPVSLVSWTRKTATASAKSGTTAAAAVEKASGNFRAVGTAAMRASSFSRIRSRQWSSASAAVPTHSTSPSRPRTGVATTLMCR